MAPTPPAGKVRVVLVASEVSPDRVRYAWQIVGDRTWTDFTGTPSGTSLSDASPLIPDGERNGVHAHLIEVVVTLDRNPDGTKSIVTGSAMRSMGMSPWARFVLPLKGYGRPSGRSGAVVPAGTPASTCLRPLVTREILASLPADIPLYKLIEPAPGKRTTFRIKLSK